MLKNFKKVTDHSFLYEIWKGEREEKMGINLDRHTLLGVQFFGFFFVGYSEFVNLDISLSEHNLLPI